MFNGSTSEATVPRFIVEYKWQFGTVTGGSATGMIAKKKFTVAGTYNVTLTVTDDAGNKNAVSKAVEVEP